MILGMKLFYSTGSCSLAAHIVLEEAGARFEAQRLNLREGEQKKPAYLAINPKGKVPALALDDGQVLTENPAVMSYVADTYPQAGLLGAPGTLERARAQEWLAWCASAVHPIFSTLFANGANVADDEAARKVAVEKARAVTQANLERFGDWLRGPFVLGERFSIADAYTLVFYSWAGHFKLQVPDRMRASVRALLARPGVQRALATQQLKLEA